MPSAAFAFIRFGLREGRQLAEAFHQHAAALAIGGETGPRRFGRALLPALRIAPFAAKFAGQFFASALLFVRTPRMR